jgi:hypothetical protein
MTTRSQSRITVAVYPGTELLNVIQLLSDSAQVTKSTYHQDILNYFGKYKNHPAVQKARDLPFINCDFPLRMSWAFYDFPKPKLYPFKNLGAYNKYFQTEQVLDYFRACLDFYKDSRFRRFSRKYEQEYDKWISSFKRNLYEAGQLPALDSFYRISPSKEIVFTLGALNCGSYAIPDMAGINPFFRDKMVIMVAYGNIIGRKDSIQLSPDFYSPSRISQLVWHEAGHAYIAGLFEQHKTEIEALKYIMDRDSVMKKGAGNLEWSMYLNENVTQAVTSLLRIQQGVIDRDAEFKRAAAGGFYILLPKLTAIIEEEYLKKDVYTDFSHFFPVFLKKLKQQYP